MIKKTLAAACCLLLAGAAAAAGVRVKTVEGVGTGDTREEAINMALTEAVSKVNGLSISASASSAQAYASNEIVVGDKGLEVSTASQASAKAVSTNTAGNVRSYQVISVESVSDGRLRAKLSVDVSCFDKGRQSERLRIAVVPFKGARDLVDRPDTIKFAGKLNHAVVSYLTGTRHFAVLDKDFEDIRLNELNRLMAPDVPMEERARYGQTLAADYILTGALTDYVVRTERKKVPFTNEVRDVTTGELAFEWRLIEAATGQIVMSDVVQQKITGSGAFDSTAQTAGRNIGSSVAHQIYPMAAIGFRNGQLTVAQGGTTVKVGERFQLVRQGAIQRDPYTKEQIGREETPVGVVRIARVTPKLSYASIVSCDVDLSGMAPREYLLRPLEEAASGAAAAPKTQQPAW